MTDHRRARVAGGAWFFTVGLAERRGADLLVARIDALGEAFRTVQARHPYPHGCRHCRTTCIASGPSRAETPITRCAGA
jgi:hypothetical protein